MTISDDLNHAIERHQSGHLQDAEKGYRNVLKSAPRHADANHLLGLLAYQGGFHKEAIAHISIAIEVDATQAIYHNSLGLALRDTGKHDAAVTSFERAIGLNPTYVEAYGNMGIAFQNSGNEDAAIGAFEQALRLNPQLIDVRGNLGNAYKNVERYEEAAECCRIVLEALPGHAATYCNLGVALQKTGAFDAAIEAYQTALQFDPEHLPAHINWGLALQDTGNLAGALEHFRKALALAPNSAEAHNNLGMALQQNGDIENARTHIEKALEQQPDHAKALANLGVIDLEQGDPLRAVEHFQKALDVEPQFPTALSNLLLSRLYLANTDTSENLALARQINHMLRLRVPVHLNSLEPGRPLRVGFVSADLRRHAVSSFLEGVWTYLNSDQIQLYAYATSHTEDDVTGRLRRHTTTWRKLAGMTLAKQCQCIATDKIDILLDLGGHTANNNLAIFAQKPAPIQVTWLGYSSTTGLETIDYILADSYVLPISDTEQYSETPWRLPDSYLCYTPPNFEPTFTNGPALTNGYVTFGSFNNLSKLTDTAIACWAQILRAVPESRLLLKAKQLDSPAFQSSLSRRFSAAGIETDRVTTMGRTSGFAEHLDAYNQMDIALDPFPYAGTTTTAEALWMGVPVLTLSGKSFVERVGVSMLTNTDLKEWVAASSEELVTKAANFSANKVELSAMRAKVRSQFRSSPICNPSAFSDALASAFRDMWKTHCERQTH